MRVEWKFDKYNFIEDIFLSEQEYLKIINTQNKTYRLIRVNEITWPESLVDQTRYLVKLFKNEGAKKEDLLVIPPTNSVHYELILKELKRLDLKINI